MRKIYLLMAAAAILMAGCKNNGAKKAQAEQPEAAAEEVAAAAAEKMNQAIETVEKAENMTALEAVEALSSAQMAGLEASIDETLKGNPDAVIPFAAVENKPTFNGGDANDFSKWVNEHIEYPQAAVEQNIAGRVILSFTVDKEGQVKDVKVLKGVNELLDNEAVRVVASSPKWEAGNQNGIPVSVNYTFPVIFKLN